VATYDFLTIIDAGDGDDGYYPVLSSPGAQLPVELTAADGAWVVVEGVRVRVYAVEGGGLTKVLNIPTDLTFTLVMTSCRVIAFCVKFEKGSTWFGTGAGAVIALGAMAVSAARAAHRRKGKLLTGQVRYQWVRRILAREHRGRLHPGVVRVMVNRPRSAGASPLLVEFELPRHVEPLRLAGDLARRAAAYRFTFDPELEDHERAELAVLASTPDRPVEPEADGSPGWASYTFPTSWPVTVTRRPEGGSGPRPVVEDGSPGVAVPVAPAPTAPSGPVPPPAPVAPLPPVGPLAAVAPSAVAPLPPVGSLPPVGRSGVLGSLPPVGPSGVVGSLPPVGPSGVVGSLPPVGPSGVVGSLPPVGSAAPSPRPPMTYPALTPTSGLPTRAVECTACGHHYPDRARGCPRCGFGT
jgi:hypothetical protein